MPEETKETVVVDVTEVPAAEEEKKEGKFGKWWKGVKKNVSDSMLESKIEEVWDDSHEKFGLTPYDGGLFGTSTVFGAIEGNTLTIFGTTEVKKGSVAISDKDKKAYYVLSVSPTKVKVACQGIEYERDGQIVELDPNVEEVKVIKADGRYFIYKE